MFFYCCKIKTVPTPLQFTAGNSYRDRAIKELLVYRTFDNKNNEHFRKIEFEINQNITLWCRAAFTSQLVNNPLTLYYYVLEKK